MTEETRSYHDAVRHAFHGLTELLEASADKLDDQKSLVEMGRAQEGAFEAALAAAVRVVHDNAVDTLSGLGIRYGVKLDYGSVKRRRMRVGIRREALR